MDPYTNSFCDVAPPSVPETADAGLLQKLTSGCSPWLVNRSRRHLLQTPSIVQLEATTRPPIQPHLRVTVNFSKKSIRYAKRL